MRYLLLEEILALHRLILQQSGGLEGVRDLEIIKSALSQPYMTFDGQELYPSLAEKAAILGFALIANHPFIDGNKRIGHAATEMLLIFNGYEINASIDEQEAIILKIASGDMHKEGYTEWLKAHIIKAQENF